jgi:hypothetical protein
MVREMPLSIHSDVPAIKKRPGGRWWWFVLQIGIIALPVLNHREFGASVGQALFLGFLLAFIVTLALVIISEQYRLWAGVIRRRRARRRLRGEIDEPADNSRALIPSGGLSCEPPKQPPRLWVRE